MEIILYILFGLALWGVAFYALAGLVWNFMICTAWVVYWVWYLIDWLKAYWQDREDRKADRWQRRHVPRRALDS